MLAIAGSWLVVSTMGCKPKEETASVEPIPEPAKEPGPTVTETPEETPAAAEEPKAAKSTPETPSQTAEAKNPAVVIETTKGKIVVDLYADAAPKTVANFLKLAKAGYYNGLPFHRVEPGFVIQTGLGPEKPTIPDEVNAHKHRPGALAMAKPGSRTDRTRLSEPDSASTQFYITLCPREQAAHLNAEFTVFGQVREGMDVAEHITQQDKITKIRVLEADE